MGHEVELYLGTEIAVQFISLPAITMLVFLETLSATHSMTAKCGVITMPFYTWEMCRSLRPRFHGNVMMTRSINSSGEKIRQSEPIKP